MSTAARTVNPRHQVATRWQHPLQAKKTSHVQRARLHEQIRLVELRALYDPSRKIVNFSGKLVRSAEYLHPRLHDLQGAADCVSGDPTLIVWSM